MAEIDDIYKTFQRGLRGALSAAALMALHRMKAPGFWGTTISGRKYAALHTGRLYRLIGLTAATINDEDIVVGIGDISKLDALRPISFQFSLRGKKYRTRQRPSTFPYWRAIEFGLSPITGSHFVPSALSPWSRSRGKGRSSGMSFKKIGMARITGFVSKDSLGRRRLLGGEDQRRGKLLVPIAQSKEYNKQKQRNLARLPFRQKEGNLNRFSRFFSNIGVGFMASGGQHPGVRPTYMFRRTALYLNRQVGEKIDKVINAFIGNLSEYIYKKFSRGGRHAN